MNDVPPIQEQPDDIDERYRRASALDPSRPSPWVRQVVLAHAVRVAAERAEVGERHAKSGAENQRTVAGRPSWRAALFGTLVAAAVAGLLVAPQVFRRHATPSTGTSAPTVAELEKTTPPAPSRQAESPPVPASSSMSTPASAEPSARAGVSTLAQPQLQPREALAAPAAASASVPAPALAPAPRVTSNPNGGLITQGDNLPSPGRVGDTVLQRSRAPDVTAAQNITAQSPSLAKKRYSADVQKTPSTDDSVTVTGARVQHNDAITAAPIAAAPALAERSTTPITVPQLEPSQGLPSQLQDAAAIGDMARLRMSLNEQVDINSRDDAGRTALMLATLHDHTDVVKELLANGADPNVADNQGVTPLQAARSGGHAAIIGALTHAGAR